MRFQHSILADDPPVSEMPEGPIKNVLLVINDIPINNEMAAGITDPSRLSSVLGRWMTLNRVRVGLWTVQWLAMMYYFARKALLLAAAGGKATGGS